MNFLKVRLGSIAIAAIVLQLVSNIGAAWAMHESLLVRQELPAKPVVVEEGGSTEISTVLSAPAVLPVQSCYRCDRGKCKRILRKMCEIAPTVGVLLVLDAVTDYANHKLYDHMNPDTPKPWDHEIITNRVVYNDLLKEYWRNKHDILGPRLAYMTDGLIPVFMFVYAGIKHPTLPFLYTGLLAVVSTAYFGYSLAPIIDMRTNLDVMDKDPILLHPEIAQDFFNACKFDAYVISALIGVHAVGLGVFTWWHAADLGFYPAETPPMSTQVEILDPVP